MFTWKINFYYKPFEFSTEKQFKIIFTSDDFFKFEIDFHLTNYIDDVEKL